MAVPALVQHKGGGGTDNNTGVNAAQYFLPNPTLSGNCIVLFLSWTDTDGTLSSIVDDGGNTWSTTAAVTVVSSTNVRSSIFVLLNCNAGTKSITVNYSAIVGNFTMQASEFNNIATASALNGTTSAADVAAPALACGSFTPGNNNANGGNLIVAYFRCSKLTSNASAADHYTPGGSFSLLDGDSINSPDGTTFNQHTCQYFVQSTQAAINPSVTANSQSASDTYNCVAIALKAASAGTQYNSANGIYVRKILHYTNNFPATGTVKFVAPSQGNLRVIQVSQSTGVIKITSITDSDSNTYVSIPNTTANTWLFYAKNCTTNNALTFTVTTSGGTTNETSTRFFDVEFADTVSPLLSHADNIVTVGANLRADDDPIHTPTQTGSLIIACGPTNGGPVKNNFDPAATNPTPAAAIFDLINYTGETDNDHIDNADACAHYYNPALTTIHWNWVTGTNGTTVAVVSAEFKTAPAGAQTEIFSPPFELVPQPLNYVRDWKNFVFFQPIATPSTLGGFTPFERPPKPSNFAKDWIEFADNFKNAITYTEPFSIFDQPAKLKNFALGWIEYDGFSFTLAPPPSLPFSIFDPAHRPINFAQDWIANRNFVSSAVVAESFFTQFDPALHPKNFAQDWIANRSPFFPVLTPNTEGFFSQFDPVRRPLNFAVHWIANVTLSKVPPAPKKKKDTHDGWAKKIIDPRYHQQALKIRSRIYEENVAVQEPIQPSEQIPSEVNPNLLIPLAKLYAGVNLPSLVQDPPARPVPSLTTNPPPFRLRTADENSIDDAAIIRIFGD